MRKKVFAEVMFYDEAPRIGCGRRIVEIEKVGRLWAYVVVPATGIRQRLPASVLARLPQKAVRLPMKYRKPYAEVHHD